MRSTLSPLSILRNKHGATLFAILLAGATAAFPTPGQAWSWEAAGKGGLILWPLFGATNQLLGGLSFLVIAFWLWRRRIPIAFLVLPMLFMLVLPAWAMLSQLEGWMSAENPSWVLILVAAATLALEGWMIVEAVLLWPRARGVLEEALPSLVSREVVAAGPRGEGGSS